jgi:prepilin signal peptidase PulO-like enzyme (type II secretory pathway)
MDAFSALDEIWLRLVGGFLIGGIFGSFATMLSYRLPRGLSIVWPGSHCPACKSPLRPRDLAPVASWIAQRGKCRYCGVFIGWRYLLIEIAVAVPMAAAVVFLGFTLWALVPLALLVGSATALAMRWERPNGGPRIGGF